jgi:2-dehydropantoate 2-reductase
MLNLNPQPKIAVVGAGAIGSLIGGLLAHSGEDVTLIARQEHVEAIRAKGLVIEGVLGRLTIPVKASQALDFQPDLALLAVKTQDVEITCQQIKARMQDSPIITLQNGVRSDNIVASILPGENILSGVVMLNVQFLEPGKITYARPGSLIIGEAFGRNGQRVRDIQALLNRAIRTSISENIQGVHWTKLLVNNLANELEAMTGLSIKECMRHAGLRRIGIMTLKEGYQVIQKAGFHTAPLPGVPAPILELILRSPVAIAAGTLRLAMASSNTLSSTLQSIRRGRPTEIDYLNGEIVRLGQQVGLAAPYNTRVVEIVKGVEKSRQFQTPDELINLFQSLPMIN